MAADLKANLIKITYVGNIILKSARRLVNYIHEVFIHNAWQKRRLLNDDETNLF
jgi:hypothetical protein